MEKQKVIVKGRSVGPTTMTDELDQVKDKLEEAKEKLEALRGNPDEPQETQFNSIEWLREKVEKEFADEREVRRKKRNQRKSIAPNTTKISAAPMRQRKLRAKRNEKCPCGSDKKYKNCCGINPL